MAQTPRLLLTLVIGSWHGRYSRSTTDEIPSKPWSSIGHPGHVSGCAAAVGCTCAPVVCSSPRRPGAGSDFALLWQKGTSSRGEIGFSVALVADLVRAARGSATSGLQGCTSTRDLMAPIFAVASRPPPGHSSSRQRCGRRCASGRELVEVFEDAGENVTGK